MNIEKLLKMLAMELTKARETNDFETLDSIRLELDRFNKIEYKMLKDAWESLILEALDGNEETELGKYKVTYKSANRFALDSKKLREEYKELSDDEFKNKFYSHSQTKPSIKLKEL
jgi:predicted phage-related endonuclease